MNNESTAAAAAESPAPIGSAEPMTLGRIVARLSGHLDPDKHGTGTLAELRRIDEHDDLPAAFWRFYLKIVPEEWREPDGVVNKTIDYAWADLTRAMIEMAPRPHSFDMPLGAFPISRSRAHTHRRHGHPLQTVPSAGLIERPQEKNRVDALR